MSRGKHSEAEMIAALKQVEAGRKVEDVAREVGVSKHTSGPKARGEWPAGPAIGVQNFGLFGQ